MNEVKMGNKTPEEKKVADNLEKSYKSREEVVIFFRDYAKRMLDAGCKVKQDGKEQEEREQRAAGLKILTPKNASKIVNSS